MLHYRYPHPRRDFNELIGETPVGIDDCKEGSGEIVFRMASGRQFQLLHVQDCCENVRVVQVDGDPNDLLGHPITLAEEISKEQDPNAGPGAGYLVDYWGEWTSYKLANLGGLPDY